MIITLTSFAQSNSVYKMYRTQNYHNQLRLNTMTGEVQQINPTMVSRGLHYSLKKGECITTSGEIEVMQVLAPNVALTWTGGFFYSDRILVLLINYDDKSYYDEQKIKIPSGKCARQIGTYRYTAKNEMVKTVPAIIIE